MGRLICQQLAVTVPKAVVHLLVRRAERSLLERLHEQVTRYSQADLQAMLREPAEVVARREAARRAIKEVETARAQLEALQARREMAAASSPHARQGLVSLPLQLLHVAGNSEVLHRALQRRAARQAGPEATQDGYTTPRAMISVAASSVPPTSAGSGATASPGTPLEHANSGTPTGGTLTRDSMKRPARNPPPTPGSQPRHSGAAA